MAIQTTRWSPDTCGCILEYTWDDSVPAASRVHTISRAVNVCNAHTGLVSLTDVWNNILPENQRKNLTYSQLLTISGMSSTDSNGNLVLKNGITINFSWSGSNTSRVLTVSVSGLTLTTQQKNTIQNFCDTTFGAGKVIVQ